MGGSYVKQLLDIVRLFVKDWKCSQVFGSDTNKIGTVANI
jgi:hypothetical protein